MCIIEKILKLLQLTDPPSGRWLKNIRHLGLMNTPSFLNSQKHFFSIKVEATTICGPQNLDFRQVYDPNHLVTSLLTALFFKFCLNVNSFTFDKFKKIFSKRNKFKSK